MTRPLYQALAARYLAAAVTPMVDVVAGSSYTAQADKLFEDNKPRIDGFLITTLPTIRQTKGVVQSMTIHGYVAATAGGPSTGGPSTGGSYNVTVRPCLVRGIRVKITRRAKSNVDTSCFEWLEDAWYTFLTTPVDA